MRARFDQKTLSLPPRAVAHTSSAFTIVAGDLHSMLLDEPLSGTR
jgi:hypothetical protein